MPSFAIILLAAGASQRMGYPKQLLDHQGRPLVRVAADTMLSLHPAAVAVVLGAHSPQVTHALEGSGVELVANPGWQQGIGTSIAAGVRWAMNQTVDAALIALCDQPAIEASHYRELIDHLAEEVDATCSEYEGTRGVPAVFKRTLFDRLALLNGDRGAKVVLADAGLRIAAIACPAAGIDLDTREDVQRFRMLRQNA